MSAATPIRRVSARPVLLGLALLLPFAASPAAAQNTTFFGYNVNASLRARVGPTYEGSDKYRLGPAFGLSLSKPGSNVWIAPDDGASLAVVGGSKASAGLAARLRSGRDDKDELRGMREIDLAGEIGLFGEVWPTDWLRGRVEVRKGVGGHSGVVADLGADLVSTEGRWRMSIGPRYSYADAEFTRTYFGVTPAEALASPYIAAAYRPGAGPRYVGATASADYQWSDRWRITSDASYRKLMGDGADSPLVKDLGTDDQFSVSLGLRYAFGL